MIVTNDMRVITNMPNNTKKRHCMRHNDIYFILYQVRRLLNYSQLSARNPDTQVRYPL